MSHHAIIAGLSGSERYMAKDGAAHPETSNAKQARRFRSAESAGTAAKTYLATFPGFIQRGMSFRVEAAEGESPEAIANDIERAA
jgi:hypothetical protein